MGDPRRLADVRDPRCLFSAAVEGASAFYRSLGFTETFGVPDESESIRVDLALSGCTIGAASIASASEDHGLDPASGGARASITPWTDDAAAADERLSAAGTSGRARAPRWLEPLPIAWVEGPDGHSIQLVQKLPHASDPLAEG